ncbi:MAG: aminopeptidase P family protein [Deltaproteobacteria bacterium]|nr:aminopeptidase P family protein [Deltaproteobacteria bacterium]
MVINNFSSLKDVMRSARCDAILITCIENIRYLTGFTGSSGVLLITDNGGIFFTDSRYTEQAGKEVKGKVKIREYKKQVPELSAAVIGARLKKVGFEDSDLTFQVYQALKKELKGVKLAPLKDRLTLLRGVKSKGELRLISGAVDIAYKAFEKLLPSVKPGKREDDLAVELEYLMRKGGAEGLSFDVIVASGGRSALPHGRAGDRLLKMGDPVVIDFGARYKGYHSDETITLFIGKASERLARIYHTVKEAHDRAIDVVRPGVRFSDIDKAARWFIKKAGYGDYFGHGTGHGVGLNVHEGPSISPNSKGVAEEGMVFTIEPGIYIPKAGGVRIEDMVVVTKNGCRVLTRIPKEMTII